MRGTMNALTLLHIRLAATALAGLVALVGILWSSTVEAQDATLDAPVQPEALETAEPVRVGVYVSPPFVTRTEDGYAGMAIELWNALSADGGFGSEFVEYPTYGALVDATEAGEVAVAVTNLTITEARAARIDFTQPWFDAGLQIMVSDIPPTGFGSLIDGLAASGHLRTYAWIIGIILVATVLLALFDRRFDPKFPARWREGLAESFYTVMSVATSGKPPSRAHLFGWVGRIFSALWLVCGIAVLAYVTSSVTSVMTTIAITDHIDGPGDLPGKSVGVLAGSTSEDYARVQGLRIRTFADIDQAATALEAGRIDAVVADAPVLDFYAHTTPDHAVRVVGELFEPDKYGFGLPLGSDLARPLTVDLLGLDEDGTLEALRTSYFGPRQ